MDNNETNRDLLENVSITDVGGSQYMLQRMSVENHHLLNNELLQHHSGLVVDLGGGDFIPVNYTSDDLLPQELTEEDRNLAAALVAVQFNQQQKQQHNQQDSTVIINTSLASLVNQNDLDKVTASAINSNYLHIVGPDGQGLYIEEKSTLPKLLDNRFQTSSQEDSSRTIQKQDVKSEEENSQKESDGETKNDNRSSKKSLPHKKRISRKLKKAPPSGKNKAQKCTLCEQIFPNNEELLTHQTICQTTITPVPSHLFNCQLCSATFYNQLSFFEHLKAHYEPTQNNQLVTPTSTTASNDQSVSPSILNDPTTSVTCEDPSTTAGNYAGDKIIVKTELEQKEVLLSSLLNLNCLQCNKTFKRQKAYEAHIRDVHNKVELADFSESEDLMDGIDVNVDDPGALSDDDSKNWMKYKDEDLYQAEADLRELEAEEHVCQNCKQPFPIRAILLQHLVTCKPPEGQQATEPTKQTWNASGGKKRNRKKQQGDLSCSECDRVFMYRNSLLYHMRSHTGDRPHQCDQCGKKFFAASALKVHLRLHSGVKPYKCDHCGRYFRQWGDLKYHCISLHSDQKNYQCEYCGKEFARKYSLVVHRRIHTGEKNYRCEFCDKTFRASSYLNNHRRIHTGEKPHACEICGKPFRVRSDMKRHLKTHRRRRQSRSTISPSCDVIVAKKEELNESSGNMLIDSDTDPHPPEVEHENAVQTLQFDQDPLEIRDGSTLYVMPILIT
ncbi:zinc finger protein 808 [Agrilus planipennis]|uniref:Zinc finger protein 808 n=1 Tax=Agrilus planipennis TaxID=224129 RepID=A0A1W4XBK0_AGRPL|nr:zinc finger protein 808 [Agrilus planipennis]